MNFKMMGRFVAQILSIEGIFMIPALCISLPVGRSVKDLEGDELQILIHIQIGSGLLVVGGIVLHIAGEVHQPNGLPVPSQQAIRNRNIFAVSKGGYILYKDRAQGAAPRIIDADTVLLFFDAVIVSPA